MALTVRFDIDPATRKALGKLHPRAINQAFVKGGRSFQIWALKRLPRETQAKTKSGTGTLARSWRVGQITPRWLVFTNDATSSGRKRIPYATFVEFGTRTHPIAPVRGKVLAWRTPGGKMAFSRGHEVKGIRARRIFLGFWRRNAKRLSQFIGEALNRELATR